MNRNHDMSLSVADKGDQSPLEDRIHLGQSYPDCSDPASYFQDVPKNAKDRSNLLELLRGVLDYQLSGIEKPSDQLKFLTKEYLTNFESLRALSSDILDYIQQKVDDITNSIESQIRRQEEHTERVVRDSRVDALTRLYNRGYFDSQLRIEINRARKNRVMYGLNGSDLALLIIDVDKFKFVNDTFGHPKGDDVLQQIAHLIKANVRSDAGEVDYSIRDGAGTSAYRYGGEEITVIAPETTKKEVAVLAERLRSAIENYDWSTVLGKDYQKRLGRNVTISIGGAVYTEDVADPYTFIVADTPQKGNDKEPKFEKPLDGVVKEFIGGKDVGGADDALYWAKEHGRNRVKMCEAQKRFEHSLQLSLPSPQKFDIVGYLGKAAAALTSVVGSLTSAASAYITTFGGKSIQ